MRNCIILNYHSVVDSSNQEETDPIYSVNVIDFKEHIKMIKASGLKIITIPEIYNSEIENSVSITFDDGFTSDFNIVFPLLKEYGITASFFITMKNVSSESPRWKEYQELAFEGNYIGAHGVTHNYLSDMEYSQQLFELYESKKTILQKIGFESLFFSLPGGKYNAETISISKSLGLKGLLTTDFGLFDLDRVPFLLKRCTIHKNYSKDNLRKLLNFDISFIQKETCLSKLKKAGQKILGNKHSDRLNYLLRG